MSDLTPEQLAEALTSISHAPRDVSPVTIETVCGQAAKMLRLYSAINVETIDKQDAEIARLRADLEATPKIGQQLIDAHTEIERLRMNKQSADRLVAEVEKENERLRALCLASMHLFKGSDAIYDPRGDVGPTHWLATRDRLIEKLGEALGE